MTIDRIASNQLWQLQRMDEVGDRFEVRPTDQPRWTWRRGTQTYRDGTLAGVFGGGDVRVLNRVDHGVHQIFSGLDERGGTVELEPKSKRSTVDYIAQLKRKEQILQLPLTRSVHH